MGIVAEKSLFNYSLFSATRLNVVYKMADVIAESVSSYIQDVLQNLALNHNADTALIDTHRVLSVDV